MKRLLAISMIALGAFVFWGTRSSSATASTLQTIDAHGILPANQYPECGDGQVPWAQFIINSVTAAEAPSSISVSFASDPTTSYPLEHVTGGAAHYIGEAPSLVTGATAQIDSSWSGEFVMSDYFCAAPSTTTTTTTTAPKDTTTTTAPKDTTTTTAPKDTTTTAPKDTTTTAPKDGGTTTTTAPHDTTTTTAHTSSGQGTTTTTAAKVTTTTAKVTSATVAQATTTVAKATPTKATPAAHSGLAFTGSQTNLLLSWAAGLLMMGGILVLSARRLPSKK